MKELTEGAVPTELRSKYPKGLSVALENRVSQDYVPPPPPKYISFSGEGTTLGGGQPTAAGGAVNTASSAGKPKVDESKPKT